MFKLSRLNRAEKAEQFEDENAARRAWLKDEIIAAIRQVYDPEIPVNVYDLGLIYRIDINENNNVDIDMTLTSPACPVAGSLPGLVETAARSKIEVNEVNVNLVWDPPWGKERMSEEALLALDMY